MKVTTHIFIQYCLRNNLAGLLLLLVSAFAGFSDLFAQQSYPVRITTQIEPPYSPYFGDYFSASGNKWKSDILFNDFSEPEWDVKLKITIESGNLKIQTRQDYIPASPIRIFPGVPISVSGRDLAPYFNYNNLLLNGITAAELSNNGKLPEGLYSFCIEVLDYRSGTPLSLRSCTNIWIRLNDEPISVTPQCGSVLIPDPSRNIVFQWHQSNTLSPNSSGTEYQLKLYEVTDPDTDPLLAIQNNKVLKVFESEFMEQNTFMYDMAQPLLDPGKKYVYTIQSRDKDGKDIFKNNGTSQPCWFWYGYPAGGLVKLISPANESIIRFNEFPYLKWTCPDRVLSGQAISYHLKIIEIDSIQTSEYAINTNIAWYEENTISSSRHSVYETVIDKKPQPQVRYAWQVKAFSADQQIAESPVYTFYGPGVIESFLAGDHEVLVIKTVNKDLNNLNGTGLVKMSKNGKTQSVDFNNLSIIKVAGRYVLDYGTITADLSDTSSIELLPDMKENLSAFFHPKKMKLDKNSLDLYGYVNWQLPHVTSDFKTVFVHSGYDWLNFDKLKLNGGIALTSANCFTLLDPYLFGLNLFNSSDFLINDNKYYLRFDGEILSPYTIKGTEPNSGNVKFPFRKADQLFYIVIPQTNLTNNILPLPYSNLVMKPLSFIIDLSEQSSPPKISDVTWKGLYLTKFRMEFYTNADKYGQLALEKTIIEDYMPDAKNNYKCWIGGDGLNLSLVKNFTRLDLATFNKFPATLQTLKLNIEKGFVKDSRVTGNIIIPFISTSKTFSFTAPVSNTGIQPGYLDSLDGTNFIFNKGSEEQELNIKITRGVFADRERIDMTLDLNWPSLGISLNALTGFKSWGNYKIGFITPDGTMSFSTQVNGNLSNYPVTFDGIGAGSSNGAYAFGVTGKAVLAEDVSGEEGAPFVNVYSTVPNSMLPQTPYIPTVDSIPGGNFNTPADIKTSFDDNVNTVRNSFIRKLYKNSEEPEENNIDLNTQIESDKSYSAYEISDLIDQNEPPEEDSRWTNIDFTFNQEALADEILSAVTIAIAQPFTDSISSKVNTQLSVFNRKVDKIRDSINVKIDRRIHTLLDTLADRTARKVKTDNFDATLEINTLADSLANKLSREIQSNIISSIDNNIKNPVNTFINSEITGRTNDLVKDQIKTILLDLLDRKINISTIIDNLVTGIPDMIIGISEDAIEGINPDKVKNTIIRIGEDALGNIKAGDIDELLIHTIDAEASNIISKKLSALGSDALDRMTDKIMNDNGEVSGNVGLGIKMNFQDLGRNLKEGRVDKVVKLDAVSINLKTKFVSFAGFIKYTPDDEIYGDIWRGDVNLTVNLPKKFNLGGIYINGRKDDMPYWFCQISGTEKGDKPGGTLDKTAKALSQPVPLGPVNLVGASGRLYHHMTDTPGYSILPDPNTNYGALLSFVFFDAANNGTAMRLAVSAGVEIKEDGNYVIDFEGDIEVANKNPKVSIPDPLAMGAGGLSLNYNSSESHFLGKGWLVIKSKALCAKGNIMVDIRPQLWAVQIGSRDNMLMITPGCAGWGAAGWIGVNQTTANIGLGLSYSINTDFSINLKVVKAGLHIDAGIAAGIQATAQYKPDFKLLQAGVWVDLWANIVVFYETPARSGSINLVSISCKGDLLMTFEPSPTKLAGTLYGHIEILCFGVDFDAGFEKTLN